MLPTFSNDALCLERRLCVGSSPPGLNGGPQRLLENRARVCSIEGFVVCWE